MSDVAYRIMERLASTMDDEQFAAAFSPEGLARQCTWHTEDNWLVTYTTSRIRAGELNGLFAVTYYEPKGEVWERVRLDRCDTRKEAKQRALRFYYEHSPQKAAKHGWTGEGYA